MSSNLSRLIWGIVLVLLFFVGCSNYNGFVTKNNEVSGAWANVQSAYQRRADLIPNIVNTVKGYADFEQSTIIAVTEARAKATSMTIDPSKTTPEQLSEFQNNQTALGSAIGRLLAVAERYPDLKANQGFLELQSQLEGTENRIKTERDKFNGTVKDFNNAVQKFPGVLFAKVFGFASKPMFEADKGTEKAPEVKF
ncbi:MAG: LemA family protein [Saprospiraceae bacterium]|nr:LemA family protein [Saprospiraceae bacterium]